MANPIYEQVKKYYGLTNLKDASNNLADANGIRGATTDATDSEGKPFSFGAASTNAIAHALSSAYIAHDYSPAEAYATGFGHELLENTPKTESWDTYKDLYNNRVGRNIAAYVRQNKLQRDQIQDLVLDALTTGKLIVKRDDPRIDQQFDGSPGNFTLPSNITSPWEGPSTGLPDYSATIRRVPVAGPREKRSSSESQTDVGLADDPAENIRYVSRIHDQIR